MKKIAILGAGTVGGSCAQILLRDAAVLEKNAGEALELAYVVDLRDMPDAPFHDKMVKDFAVVEADPEVFLVIEAIGGCGAALNFVRRSLEAGKHVVTSNKQLVAEHGTQLLALAKAHGVSFLFEASVGGGIPVLHPLSQCLGANEILEVRGILNGTTNFILTQMLEFGQSYDAALKDAQARGYAEQNPAADVDGIDAGRKICILADMMFGKNVDPARVSMTGISTITAEDAAFAESAGMKLKLLGRAIRQGEQIAVFVSPHFVAGAQPLAPVSGVLNAIEVLGNNIGNAMFFGPGAGGPATASAVLGDVVAPGSTVLVDGAPVYENPAVKARLASIPDELYYFLSASTRDMMRFFRGFYPRFDQARYQALKDVFTTVDERQSIRRLSKGMQKQSAFWLALCCRPDVLVLDEPVDGLDPVMRRQVWSLLMGDVAEHGTTVLVSSHNLRELEDVCDHVGILSRGKVLIERSLSDLQENVVKMQVVFQEKQLPQLPADLEILNISQVGRIHTLIVRGNATEVTNRLAAYAPILMEALPLTLEEIFIYELGGEDYAVRDIVL